MLRMHSVWRNVGLAGVAVWLAVAPAARAQGDLSGLYTKDGAELAIVQGDNETLVRYEAGFPQGASVGTCECPLVVQKKTAARWTLQGTEPSETWTLRLDPKRLVLSSSTQGCCGAGWPGEDSFSRGPPQALRTCKVKAERAPFFASDAANTERKTYVVSGDSVEALIPATEPDLVPARFKGPRKTTVGLLKREQLDCPAAGATAAGAQPVKAEQLQPLAGKWVELTRKGKGYVITKPCSAETRSFTVRPGSAELEVQLGQEATTAKVTDVRPGSGAVAYALEVTSADGKKEKVEWKVKDAGKGIVSLTSPDLFATSHDYVRDDKKAAFPVKAQTGCDEYER